MARRKELCGIQGGSGAFSLLFTVTEDDGPINVVVEENEEKKWSIDKVDGVDYVLSKEDTLAINAGILQLICDNIPTKWRSKTQRGST